MYCLSSSWSQVEFHAGLGSWLYCSPVDGDILDGFVAGAAAASVGLLSDITGDVLAETDFAGNLNITSVYQTENDLPDQYAALQDIYKAPGGEYWGSGYQQLIYAEEIDTYASSLSTSSKSMSIALCSLHYLLC